MACDNLAHIAVSGVPYIADRLYTYLIPAGLCGAVRAGVRVTVPFGRGNRKTEGIVLETLCGAVEPAFKPIAAVLDEQPLLNAISLRLIKWMKARYFCTCYDALKAILPAGVWFRYRRKIRLSPGQDAALCAASYPEDSMEAAVLRAVSSRGSVNEDSLKKLGEDSGRAVRALAAAGIVEIESMPVQSVRDKSVRMVRLAVRAEDALASVEKRRKAAPVRFAVVELLCAEGELNSADLCYYTGATRATLRGLEKDGLIAFSQSEVLRVRTYASKEEAVPIVLNEEQQSAFAGLDALAAEGKAAAALLHGVTASGKTQVYIRLIQQALARGKTALVLVPEIALTPQMMAKFTACFGESVAMLHSGLRLTERYDQWKRIRRGEARVVLGTRSAVFAPLDHLGLIIMDEEQEGTYQSENPPRYHTRDIAQFLCAQHDALLVLGSATPTVETSYYARSGRYHMFRLRKRYNDQSLPKVLIADLREDLRAGNDSLIGAALHRELAENIARGEQSILFLNRRGNARMVLCGACGAVPECPRCSAPLTYHSANERLMCHYCGYSEPMRERCPECGGLMKHIGAGTQKVEDELHALFPGTEVLRMDTDTVGATHSHEQLLDRFSRENVPILLGTQMVAKGLDFENVTLVGVLTADLSLYVDHYRAAERTFSLLSQVVGRAGRGSKQGRAVIQTYTPENDVIRAAAAQDYEAFYESELRLRRLRRYPPFADLFTLTVSGIDEGQVQRACAALHAGLCAAVQREELRGLEIEVLGPAGAPVVKVNNRFRYRVFLVGKNCPALRHLVSEFLFAFHRHRENRGLDIFADCNALQ